MTFHPIADELPLLSNEEYQALVEDIRKHGQLNPVIVDEKGKVIDGRHRWRACKELGIEVKTELFTGTNEEKRAHSKGHNYIRRHLSHGQKSMHAGRDAKVKKGSNQHEKKEGLQNCRPSKTNKEAAKDNQVSERMVYHAKCVLDHGIDELIAAVDANKVRVNIAAKIAKLPAKQQRQAIKNNFKMPQEPHPKDITEQSVIEPAKEIENPASPPIDVPVTPEQSAKEIIDQASEFLPRLLKAIESLDRNSDDAKRLAGIVNSFHAAVTSHCCDMSPVPEMEEPSKAKPLTHVEVIELTEEQFDDAFKSLKKIEGWADTKERSASVRRFVTKCRKSIGSFEKYTTVGAEPKKTLFEADADIPEHLQTEEFMAAWQSWWEDRKRRKLSLSDMTKRKQLKLLAIGDAEQATAIVGKAEENQWQGIPDGVWIPQRNIGLWCDRLPLHACSDLREKIQAATQVSQMNGQRNMKNGSTDRSGHGKSGVELTKLSFEEQRRLMLGAKQVKT